MPEKRMVSFVAELRNLEKLTLMHCRLESGNLQNMLAGKSRLGHVTLFYPEAERGKLGAGDAQSITELESLKSLSISGRKINASVVEMFLRNRAFVSGLERLYISATICAEPAGTGMETLGSACRRRGAVRLDTGSIEIFAG